ncbi:MAG: hypothetical protein IJ039_07970 [Clostridia bacterium]|nr:hypothetical protein [Clostridia bacterium]
MRVSSFLQTPFISYDDKNLIYIKVQDWDMCNPYGVEIFIGGEKIYGERVFAAELSCMIPCYKAECVARVRLTPFEELPIEQEFTVKPPRNWQIPLLYSSHEDLGYCAYIEKLHYECYEYLKKAMELCKKHSGFKYMIEHYWWLDAFDFYASCEEKQELRELFAKKRIELNSIHSGVHTSWANAEHLVRQMYFGCIEAKEKYGVEPQCALYTDLSGASSAILNAYTQMGIKYVGFFPNGFRNCEENRSIPPIFWWEDKQGKSRMLLWHQRAYRPYGLGGIWCDTKRQYNEGKFYFDQTKRQRTEKWLSQKISETEQYGYNIYPICFYDDRELPTDMLITVCEEMNKKWKYPHFYMEIPSVLMSELESKFGDKIPTYKGDISDQWADFATIAPNMLSKKRSIMRKLYDAEMLSVIESIKNGKEYNSKAFRDIYFRLSEFDEHCWATSSKHPQKMHRHNIERVKRDSVYKSSDKLEGILNSLCPKADGEKISIINTIPNYRKSHITAQNGDLIPKCLKHQILPNGTVVTEPQEFDGVESVQFEGVIPSKHSCEIKADLFETDFYKVEINNDTKKIISLIDKETGKEYIDKESRFELGQFIYVYTEQKTDSRLNYEIPLTTDFKLYEGEVAYVIVQRGYEEQSGAEVMTQLTFYKHEKLIDLDLSYENASGLIGDYYDRYKKNYFFALPFKLDKPEFYTELAVGEKNEATDNIPLNANDFSVAQNWLVAENDKHGVAIYTRDMNVFHIGKIKYNQFKPGFSEDKAHFYLYASSNRCNNLIYTSIDQCYAKYHLSILTYGGKHNSIVPLWSNQNDRELIISDAKCDYGKLLRLSASNIRLIAFKRAEGCGNAVVLRFVETEGKDTECDMELFFKPTNAVYATNDERELEKIKVNENRVSFTCQAYSYVTLKLFGNFDIKELQ